MFSRNRSTIAYARFRESGKIDIFHGDEDAGVPSPMGVISVFHISLTSSCALA
jgi:hypothetical protein